MGCDGSYDSFAMLGKMPNFERILNSKFLCSNFLSIFCFYLLILRIIYTKLVTSTTTRKIKESTPTDVDYDTVCCSMFLGTARC